MRATPSTLSARVALVSGIPTYGLLWGAVFGVVATWLVTGLVATVPLGPATRGWAADASGVWRQERRVGKRRLHMENHEGSVRAKRQCGDCCNGGAALLLRGRAPCSRGFRSRPGYNGDGVDIWVAMHRPRRGCPLAIWGVHSTRCGVDGSLERRDREHRGGRSWRVSRGRECLPRSHGEAAAERSLCTLRALGGSTPRRELL